jgi:hypothetical protein
MFAQVDTPGRFSKTVRQMKLHGLRWFIRLLQGGLIHGLMAHRFYVPGLLRGTVVIGDKRFPRQSLFRASFGFKGGILF